MDNRHWMGWSFCLFLAVSITFCLIGFVSAADLKQFSADMVTRSGGQIQSAKIYVSEDKTRTEIPGSIVITRLDKNVAWMIMPSERMYMESQINQAMVPKTSGNVGKEVERVSMGKEAVDGVSAEKFKLTYMEKGQQKSMYQWLTDAGFPIKMEDADGSWSIEYKNVSLGPQPDSLFEPPEGYQKLAMPFGAGSKMPSMDDIQSQAGE